MNTNNEDAKNLNFPEDIIIRPEMTALYDQHLNLLEKDIEGYKNVGYRDIKLFKWLVFAFENLGLSTVEEKYLNSLVILKTRFTIFEVMIDDIVDNQDKRNLVLFEELLKIPFNSDKIETSKLTKKEIEYLEFTKLIWFKITNELSKYPNYKKYKEAFEFDVYQMLNSMRYSRFVNTTPQAINLLENKIYVPHGMIILIQLDFDLMCSKGFDDNELGTFREIAYLSQRLAKIGNLIATYPRELLEYDMSSEAVIRFAKDYGFDFKFKLNKLLNKKNRYPDFEKELIDEWEKQYKIIKELADKIKSIDMDRFMRERNFLQVIYKMRSY